MNKYIKKCLIVYTSLALILVGMAGAAYAVTASDADKYVTRSQFATDMAYLQNALDDKEAGLMGNIDRYRSTEMLFTTWDTPDLQSLGTGSWQGYHNGGNIFPKPIYSSGTWHYAYGVSNDSNNFIYPYHNPLYLFRLWNGNYYITNYVGYRTSVDTSASANYYRGLMKCAVPVENLPGWYLVLSTYQAYTTYVHWCVALVKLDPNVPYGGSTQPDWNQIYNMDLRIRFKKDLWKKIYSGRTMPTSSTPVTGTYSCSYYANDDFSAFTSTFKSSLGTSSSNTLTMSAWVDEETGDYMQTIKGLAPYYPGWGQRHYTLSSASNFCVLGGLIPSDNVEYMMGGPFMYSTTTESGEYTNYVNAVPSPRFIGMTTGSNIFGNDAFDIEIVEGVNGIKYWHTYKRPSKSKTLNGYVNSILGWHYSLPIVY